MATLPKTSPEEEALIEPEPARSPVWLGIGVIVRTLLVLAILAASGYASYRWLANPPVAQRRPPQKEAALAEVVPAHVQAANVIVRNMGTVVPAREVSLAARVSGQLAEIAPAFVPGGHFVQGETMVRIDSADYELAVEQQQANLVKAQSDLKLEMGQQSVAQLEYKLLGENAPEEDEALLLRQPQLESMKAAVAIAQAGLNQARLDLERTVIAAPFNAVIQERKVDLGAYVNPGMPLATLVDSDEYWVEVTVPVDELRWLQIPGFNGGSGSQARIYHEPAWGPGVYREGQVLRILTDLEEGSRMARLLLAVKDPLQLGETEDPPHPLILGAAVRIEMIGKELSDIVTVPASAVREGEYVWIMTPEKTLEIRPVEAAWRDVEVVYVSKGVQNGELLVVSDLATPVSGMPLRAGSNEPAPAGEKTARSEGEERQP